MPLIYKMVVFASNTQKSGSILVEQLHHVFSRYINPRRIKFIVNVHVPRLFHLMHEEETIILLNILFIVMKKWQKNKFKPQPWYILTKYDESTFRHIWIRFQPPVPPVENYDQENHVEPTYNPLDKFSRVNCMFQKIIHFGYE